MAAENALMNYNFSLEVNGIVQAYVQSAQVPFVENTLHKLGTPGNDPDLKAPGKKQVGDLVLENLVNAPEGDIEVWRAIERATYGLSSGYRFNGFFNELGPDNTIVRRFHLRNCFIQRVESGQHDSRGDNNAPFLRTVTVAVSDYKPVDI